MRIKSTVGRFVLLGMSLSLIGCVALERPAEIDAYLQDRMDSAGIPGMAVGVIRSGDLAYTGYFGYADIESERPVSSDTRFMIASVSKTVTSAALMLLESRGQIDIDRSISDYLPFEVSHPRQGERVITARMLLTHTSGIVDNWDVLDALYTIADGGGDSNVGLERLIRGYVLPGGEYYSATANFASGAPGTIHSYSNIGFAMIGYLVEVVSGMPFDQFCENELFEPLGMTSTSWFLEGLDPLTIATPYAFDGDTPSPLPHYGYATYPDGQLRTTIEDYARFLQVFLRHEVDVLSRSTVDEILRIQDEDTHRWQAIAWNYDETESFLVNLHLPHRPAHSGGDPGVATFTMIDPVTGGGFIVFTNGMADGIGAIKSFYLDIMKRLALEAGML